MRVAGMKPNPDFVSKVEQELPEKDQQLVLVRHPAQANGLNSNNAASANLHNNAKPACTIIMPLSLAVGALGHQISQSIPKIQQVCSK